MQHTKLLTVVTLLMMISACSTNQQSRYHMANDKAPSSAPDVSKVEDAYPKFEPYSRGGNKKITLYEVKTTRL